MYTCYGYHCNQSTLKYNKPKKEDLTETSFATQPPIKRSSKPLQNEIKGHIWHKHLGHTGKDTIKQLPQSVTGTLLKGPIMVKYQLYGVSKAHKIVFRRQLI